MRKCAASVRECAARVRETKTEHKVRKPQEEESATLLSRRLGPHTCCVRPAMNSTACVRTIFQCIRSPSCTCIEKEKEEPRGFCDSGPINS